jgi:hypothetical protein
MDCRVEELTVEVVEEKRDNGEGKKDVTLCQQDR